MGLKRRIELGKENGDLKREEEEEGRKVREES